MMTENGNGLVRVCAGRTKTGEPCRSRVVNASGFCIQHDVASRELVQEARCQGGRRRAENVHAALEQWLERKQQRIVRVYDEALLANKIAVDQRTAQAVDTGQPDHPIRLQAAREAIDRVHGEPTTRTELTGSLTLAALMADSPQAITDTQ